MAGHAFYADAMDRSNRRIRRWYHENLMSALQIAKERQVRDIDVSIGLAEELLKKLNEPFDPPIVVPLRDPIILEDDRLMKPIEPEVLDILYGGTEKGATNKYLNVRNKKAPEDKYFFRITSNWDYGWQHRQSRVRARDFNRGRCAVLRDTFYRKSNLGPDPPHYAAPSGGEVAFCSENSCKLIKL